MQVYNDEHLYHTGVKGMKWGHRQNKSTIPKGGSNNSRGQIKTTTGDKLGKYSDYSPTKKYSDYYKSLTTGDKIKIGAAMTALLLASASNQ